MRVRSLLLTDVLVSLPHVECAGILDPSHSQQYFDFIKESIGADGVLLYQGRTDIPGLVSSGDEALFEMDLPDNPQAILSHIPSEVIRKGMKKSLAEGYSVTFGNNSSLRKEFYASYIDKMKEFGTPPQSFRYVNKIVESFRDCCVIAIVKRNSIVVGASLDVLFHDHLYKLYFSVSREQLRNKAGYFLEYKSLEHAVLNGVRRVVLGRSTRGSGAASYKERLGGKALPLHIYNLKISPSGYVPVRRKTVKQKFRSASVLWRRLPLKLTVLLGPSLRKRIY